MKSRPQKQINPRDHVAQNKNDSQCHQDRDSGIPRYSHSPSDENQQQTPAAARRKSVDNLKLARENVKIVRVRRQDSKFRATQYQSRPIARINTARSQTSGK